MLIISGWNLSWGEGYHYDVEPYWDIISGWNLSWGEGSQFVTNAINFIISGWNLSWGEGEELSAVRDELIISGWNLSWVQSWLASRPYPVGNDGVSQLLEPCVAITRFVASPTVYELKPWL